MVKFLGHYILSAMVIISLLGASSCYAGTPIRRGEASSSLTRIQKSAPPGPLYREYTSIMETYSQAERLWEQNRLAEAGKLFELVILKIALYEKELDSLAAASINETPSAARDLPSEMTQPSANAAAHPERTGSSEKTSLREPAPDLQGASLVDGGQRADDSGALHPVPLMIIGEKRIYTVRKGDSLRLIGAKLGINWRLLAKQNHLNPAKFLRPGQKLTINTRRIVPKTMRDGILINIPDRTLYLFKNRKLEKALPVGLGMTKWREKEVWQTPTGKFRILSKIKDPAWHVPLSIQEKMKLEGKEVKTLVPPGSDNPLGKFALKTSLPGILIHGTIVPESVYAFSSHGCIRVHPATMEEIFKEIRVNTSGEIIYQPVKVALSEDGRVYLEVHRDIYNRYENLRALAQRMIRKNNAELMVDWSKVSSLLKKKSGIPEDITCSPDR